MNDAKIKAETLESVVRDKEELLSYLAALVAAGGEISLNGRELSLDFVTYNSALAYDFSMTVKSHYGFGAEISIKQPEDKRYNRYFTVSLPSKISRQLLRDTKIVVLADNGDVKSINFGVSAFARRDEKNFSNYIRGLFLACGKVFIYEGNYIAEMLLPNADFAAEISEMLAKYDIICGQHERMDKTALTIKAGDMVSSFLALCGAAESSLELISILIRREMSNNINRQANCEAANSDKTATAAVEQVRAIMDIQRLKRMDKLSAELVEVAEFRLANPDMPLAGMAAHFKLTKSGISHRIKRIMRIAEELVGEENK